VELKKIIIAVSDYAEIVRQIDEIAAREGVSRSDIIRRAIRQFLASLNVRT
jgi:metal-responsive CopG/Arc/MetJ family transcriptional regulator